MLERKAWMDAVNPSYRVQTLPEGAIGIDYLSQVHGHSRAANSITTAPGLLSGTVEGSAASRRWIVRFPLNEAASLANAQLRR